MRFVGLASIFLLTSLLGSRARAQTDRGDGAVTTSSSRRSMPAADDAELERTAHLQTILRVALDRNRDVAENQARSGQPKCVAGRPHGFQISSSSMSNGAFRCRGPTHSTARRR